MSLLRSEDAPPPRTLVEVFRATTLDHGDRPALDNGAEVLTYAELLELAEALADELADLGVGPGDRVGVRVPSGTLDLYVAVLGVLVAGAAYVPVDADDPDERARLVFGEAGVVAVVGASLGVEARDPLAGRAPRARGAGPSTSDDAWIIFTSGSTGTPKGVAVSHRSAAAFVDAEARLFLPPERGRPLGPEDRVMAGLSVAFDASCEEIWLAWRYGGCLVPAPRALVRSGVDVGPWLVANDITVVSTVPTLVSLWPDEALARVRLLILGGEAFPPELAARLARPGREVWNTYGPTEATVVACGAEVDGVGPVRIGLPLPGWDLAVVDADGRPVAEGEQGELVIGGVGLARYLDPAKDAEKYAAMPTLGWDRAYRSGDLVVNDAAGLRFVGRADDQVKVGGRRIELGEIDSALLSLPGVVGAAAAIRRSATGNQLIVGYVRLAPPADDTAASTATETAAFDATAAAAHLRATLPAALVPRLAVVDDLPTRTSGKVDRDALPWPLETPAAATAGLTGTAAHVAEVWDAVVGAAPSGPDDDFFDLGGGSLTAAQVVTMLRRDHPEVTVADLYDHPTLGGLAAWLDQLEPATMADPSRRVPPIPPKSQAGQLVALPLLRALAAPRWVAWGLLGARVLHDGWLPGAAATGLPAAPWWVIVALLVVFVSPPGRMLVAAALVRATLAGVEPGEYPRGGKVHLRLWAAERVADQVGALALSGAAAMSWWARLLGARVGRDVDLHALPPISGALRLGRGCSIEPEVDLTGYWVDGDRLHLGRIEVGPRARVGARSTLCPGAVVGADAEVAPGSAVFGSVPEGEFWSGAPAERVRGAARGPWSERPPTARAWTAVYLVAGLLLGALPALAVLGSALVWWPLTGLDDGAGAGDVARALLVWAVPGTLLALVLLAALVLVVVRVAAVGLTPGVHPVRSVIALRVWCTMRVLDEARTWLFGLYSSQLTPGWLRLLGARIGRDVEASTALLLPSLTHVNHEAFLADDTLIGGYELGGGWLRVERVKVGKRAFVGNSGMTAPGRKVPKRSLVAVLSATPGRADVTKGASWLGSPPAPLRRAPSEAGDERTYAPSRRLKVARGLWEAARVVPVVGSALLTGAVVLAGAAAWTAWHPLAGVVVVAVALVVAGAVAALVTVAAKWLLVGRVRPGDHPLWSSFVWRNELADTFVEVLAAPWFARLATGSPLLPAWFRLMGSRMGRGVWCETYWLPETDLVALGDGATVNPGTVVQTHLFHDRVLSTGAVVLEPGATLGPNSVILPAAGLGRHATVGPVSLVMRGESVPDKTRWIGNPIGPWNDAPAPGEGAA